MDLGLSLSVANYGSGGDSTEDGDESSAENVGLPGRTPSVTLARELLYRLNEMAYNTQLAPADYQKSFDAIVTVVGDVAKQEMQQSQFSHTYGVSDSVTLAQSSTQTESESVSVAATESSSAASTDDSGDAQDQ